MRLIIDLDGTICTEEKTFSRTLAKPIRGAKEALCKLRDAEHTIIIYSARSWSEYEMTIQWLKDNQIPYDQVILGKPVGDYWIDDRALRFTSWHQITENIK
jgi:hydroxymethylpyrimidine pyrophosphatase-like HAD family hydrolase|tara:strand:- start:170 stop:472 length:303 start_codon:yes stop_codon:yes gene_type:complete